MIVKPADLAEYSIALSNSGVTQKNIDMLERQFIVRIFGPRGGATLVSYINENRKEEAAVNTPPVTKSNTSDFFEKPEDTPQTVTTYGEVTELIDGDNILFSGLRALLAVLICSNLLSQNRIQVARQTVSKQPSYSRQPSRRDEANVVQALAYTAANIIAAMDDYLKREGKNPLDLHVHKVVVPARYATDTSGRIPAASFFNLFW